MNLVLPIYIWPIFDLLKRALCEAFGLEFLQLLIADSDGVFGTDAARQGPGLAGGGPRARSSGFDDGGGCANRETSVFPISVESLPWPQQQEVQQEVQNLSFALPDMRAPDFDSALLSLLKV